MEKSFRYVKEINYIATGLPPNIYTLIHYYNSLPTLYESFSLPILVSAVY